MSLAAPGAGDEPGGDVLGDGLGAGLLREAVPHAAVGAVDVLGVDEGLVAGGGAVDEVGGAGTP